MDNNNVSPVLEQFVERLMVEKNLVNLEPAILQEIKSDLLQKAEDKIKVAIFDQIPSEKLPEFNELMEADDEARLQAFVKEQIPNLEELTAASLVDFRNTYLG